MITETETAVGVVLTRLVQQIGSAVTVEQLSDYGSTYFRVGSRAAIYVKYSSSRLTPWNFTFSEDQQTRLVRLADNFANVVVCLVCGHDGVAAISTGDIWEILGIPNAQTRKGVVSVSRRPRQQYAIRGSKGRLSRKVAETDLLAWIQGSV